MYLLVLEHLRCCREKCKRFPLDALIPIKRLKQITSDEKMPPLGFGLALY